VGRAAREARQRPDRGDGDAPRRERARQQVATLGAFGRWKNILQSSVRRVSRRARRGAHERASISRGGSRTFARWRRYGHARRSRDAARCGRAGAAPASVEVPDTTRTEKKESLFGLGREIPPSSANHLSTVGTSFFARGIFLFYASGRIRPRLTVRAVRPANTAVEKDSRSSSARRYRGK
jgi:hypothetical protein